MLESYKKRINETLETLIPSDSADSPSLFEGARYTLLAPGKRIRPLLTLSVTHMLQKESLESSLWPACALEMIHTYSLIHDDLPCMDDDDFRRGLPTLHRILSEGHAVLVGDYLLTYAFEVIATAPLLSAEQKMQLSQRLAQAAGGQGMIGGQVMDIEGAKNTEQMHALKTAALFSAAVEFGGIVSKAPTQTMIMLRSFGLQFGKLFQYVDDLVDGDHPLGNEVAEKYAQHYFESSLATLDSFPGDSSLLKKLIESVYEAKSSAC